MSKARGASSTRRAKRKFLMRVVKLQKKYEKNKKNVNQNTEGS